MEVQDELWEAYFLRWPSYLECSQFPRKNSNQLCRDAPEKTIRVDCLEISNLNCYYNILKKYFTIFFSKGRTSMCIYR